MSTVKMGAYCDLYGRALLEFRNDTGGPVTLDTAYAMPANIPEVRGDKMKPLLTRPLVLGPGQPRDIDVTNGLTRFFQQNDSQAMKFRIWITLYPRPADQASPDEYWAVLRGGHFVQFNGGTLGKRSVPRNGFAPMLSSS